MASSGVARPCNAWKQSFVFKTKSCSSPPSFQHPRSTRFPGGTVRGIEGYKQSSFQGVISLLFTFKMSGDRGGVVYLGAEAALRLPLG